MFTFKVLDDFWLSNLTCKTSTYQYYLKLQHLTSPAFPKSVPVHIALVDILECHLTHYPRTGIVNSEESVGNGEIWNLENALVLAMSPEFPRPEKWHMVVHLAPSQVLTCQVTGKRTHIRTHDELPFVHILIPIGSKVFT